MANLELNKYIKTLGQVQTAIESTLGSIRALETKMDSSFGVTGSFLSPLQNQARQLQVQYNSLLATKNQLLTNIPAATGDLPFSKAFNVEQWARSMAYRNVGPIKYSNASPSSEAKLPGETQLAYAYRLANAPRSGLQNVLDQTVNNTNIQKFKDITHPYNQALNEAYQRLRLSVNEHAQVEKDFTAATRENKALDRGTAKSARLTLDEALNQPDVLQQQRVASEFYSNPRYTKTRIMAEQAGFRGSPDITTIGTSGVQQLDWKQIDQTGATNKLRYYNTPSGNNLESTSRQFQTLTSAIGRDLRELTKWSIAIALIYGPLNALKTLVSDMVENQTRLANAMIAVSDSTLRVGEVFDIAKSSADALGTGVSDTIDSFTQAYRATGNLGSSFERITTGTTLLRDALILAKLSGMEEATAIDTLAASLRQTDTELDQGTSLLDKWVKTTQNANVDLETLSTGFAVLGDAAETAGMSVDELNGLLAAIAETGVANGKEVANTAKAIVSGFYSDKAVAQLNKLGIATKDAEGNLRDFNSIATELYQQRQLGLISDTAFQDTARAIGGGGNRRQAAVTTLIENYARVQQVAALSATASGEASEAMGRRLDTVQTSTTRLNNAFQSLAMSLGNEGGLLDLFGLTLDVVTGITNGFDALTSTMGKAGPMLMSILAGGALLKLNGPLTAQTIATGVDRFLLSGIGIGASRQRTDYQAMTFGGRRTMDLLSGGLNFTNLAAGIGLAGVLPAIGNLQNRDEDPFALQKAAANLTGALVGGLASGLLGISPIIGASIGSAIGEAFVTAATRKGNIATILAAIESESLINPTDRAEYSPDLGTDALYAAYGGLFFGGGKQTPIDAMLGKTLSTPPGILFEAFGIDQDVMMYRIIQGMAKLNIQSAKDALKTFDVSKELFKLNNPGDYRMPATSLDLLQQNKLKASGATLTDMRKQAEASLLTQLQQGDITSAEYTRKRDSLSTFEERATKFSAVFGEQLIGNVTGINDEADAYQAFLNIVANGTPEALDAITAMASEIYDTKNYIEELNKLTIAPTTTIDYMGTGVQLTKEEALNKANEKIAYLESVLPGIVEVGNRTAQASRVNMPSIVNQGDAYSRADYNKIVSQYRTDEFSRLRQLNPSTGPNAVSDAEINAYLDSQEQFGVYINDFGKYVYQLTGGIGGASEAGFKQTSQELLDKGLISTGSGAASKQNVQTLDITSAQFPLLQMYTNQAMIALKTIPGFMPDDDKLQVFGKDWIGGVIHGDQLALRLALEKLIGIEEKQLEGIYNLPDGSFFSVFLTQEWMDLMGKGGVGGGIPGGVFTGESEETPPVAGSDEGLPNNYYSYPRNYTPREDKKDRLFGAIIRSGEITLPDTYEKGSWKNSWGGRENIPIIPKIGLNLNNTTTIQLDGRILATVIKRYLAEDLVRMTSGYGNSKKDFVL